jgi:hypothetical protein
LKRSSSMGASNSGDGPSVSWFDPEHPAGGYRSAGEVFRAASLPAS